MSPSGLPVLPSPAEPNLVLVVPAGKVFPEQVAKTVLATVSALERQRPVAVIDLMGAFSGFREHERPNGWVPVPSAGGGSPEVKSTIIVKPTDLHLEGPLSLLLSELASVAVECEELVGGGRAVVVIGPNAFGEEERFWLYTGFSWELATHVVLCTDGILVDYANGPGMGARFRKPAAGKKAPPLAVVHAEVDHWHGSPSLTRRHADMVLAAAHDRDALEGPLGHLLGVFDLACGPERDGSTRGLVRRVIDAYLAPLNEWDWTAQTISDRAPDVRYHDFAQLIADAAAITRRHFRHLVTQDLLPLHNDVLHQLMAQVPSELRRVETPDGLEDLALCLLEIAEVVLSLDQMQPGLLDLLDRRASDEMAVRSALVSVLRCGAGSRALGQELVRRASTKGPALELAVFRALHEVGQTATP